MAYTGTTYTALGVRIGRLALVLLAACIIVFTFVVQSPLWPSAAKTASSALKLVAPEWTGSGVNIGGGYIITAGHVAKGLKTVDVLMSDGKKATGSVLWVNEQDDGGYDVSLVYSKDLPAASSDLSCAPTTTGESVTLVGNPDTLDFLQTWGRVSGPVKPGSWGPWGSLVAVNIAATQGDSGGPFYNDNGDVVGILVSGLVDQYGSHDYSFMVPSTTICKLLGRI